MLFRALRAYLSFVFSFYNHFIRNYDNWKMLSRLLIIKINDLCFKIILKILRLDVQSAWFDLDNQQRSIQCAIYRIHSRRWTRKRKMCYDVFWTQQRGFRGTAGFFLRTIIIILLDSQHGPSEIRGFAHTATSTISVSFADAFLTN